MSLFYASKLVHRCFGGFLHMWKQLYEGSDKWCHLNLQSLKETPHISNQNQISYTYRCFYQCFQKLHFYKPWSHVTNIRIRGVMIHDLDSTRSTWSSCTKKAEMLGAALFSQCSGVHSLSSLGTTEKRCWRLQNKHCVNTGPQSMHTYTRDITDT